MRAYRVHTSESVSEGHPDKVADQISDAVLDAFLARDPQARVACETLVTHNFCLVAGEVRSEAPLTRAEVETVVREKIEEIGYSREDEGFYYGSPIDIRLHSQSQEIAKAVDKGDRRKQGAGDQGMMYGYATRELAEFVEGAGGYIPAPICFAHRILAAMAAERKSGRASWLRPDGKSQVSVRYDAGGKPVGIERVVVSNQTEHGTPPARLRALAERVVRDVVPRELLGDEDSSRRLLVNPSGKFEHGGPAVDTGLTGRKIIVDTYGGMAHHGGGCFSGKDPSKVDRSGAYGARWLAKNIVAAGLAERCEVEVCYAIGVAEPLAIRVDAFRTVARGITQDEIETWVRENVDLSPGGIIERLDLLQPIYQLSAAYGHFGREPRDGFFTWERLDLVDEIRKRFGLSAAA
ncbi:MAG: methionine adenosyltransferase [Gemmatimonadetes bacterium]|nr:methionine adenosyltransferase [Gemmatimonadota bacterium]